MFKNSTWLILCLILIVLVVLSACQPWHKVRDSYRAHFYPDQAQLRQDPGMQEDEKQAAQLFAQADQELYALLQELQLLESPPVQGWSEELQQRQPWVASALVLDREGQVQQGRKTEDLLQAGQEIFKEHDDWQDRDLQYKEQAKGDEKWLVLSKPYAQGQEWQGLVLVFIDPESFMSRIDRPGDILLLGSELIFWPGDYPQAAQELLERGLEAKLEEKAYGSTKASGQEFFWMARFIGQEPLFYLMRR